ncbi:unnamed protein product (macronuclear) [Paramecium tetraurelia]|uniref:Protein kinase domain-containing protein n=1 Tax=Paramecium tetraurelia TaxID=5888 RepID=A0DH79_PARTE|nr:uncharacterized protein GSPATT00016782001 [Paramecium tetraurelia]CAK82396.1 unnamed protein product [Paramecium tetraurelia]|eukprot:XP_001449793.1 hypothetical protein (macronuclear) [Paramecium tetraurelia strain d4-2]
MGNIESAEGENLPELKKMKLISDKGVYKVFESPENNKYDFWSLKSKDYPFEEENKIALELKNRDSIGIAKIENIMLTSVDKLFSKYYILSILTEHPLYNLREYLQKKAKDQSLDQKQITDLLTCVVNAQYLLGSKKQYLGFDNIHTNDGKSWKIKPFVQTKSFYQEIQEYKSKNLRNFDLSGFPSPEEFHQNNCDPDRVQIFGLGMLILELITRMKSKDIYSKFQINEALLAQRIENLMTYKKQFTGRFIELIIEMLDLDIVRRPNYYQLYTKLSSNESKIESEFKDPLVQPIDETITIKSNLFKPPSQKIDDHHIIDAVSNIQQSGNNKFDYHQVTASKAQLPQVSKVDDNLQYIGSSYEGQRHGKGKLFTQGNQLVYEGDFHQGDFHNTGKFYNLKAQMLKENFYYNDCTKIDQYASKYEGSFQFGKKHGQGKLFLTNGEIFIGRFANDLIDGQGKFELNNQIKFSGVWESGRLLSNNQQQQSFQNHNPSYNEQFEGISKLDTKRSQQFDTQALGDTQTHNVLSDIKQENESRLYYDDNKTQIKYVGSVNQGLKHGKGILYFKKGGPQYEGHFKNDQYDGQGILYNENPVFEDQINYSLLREVQIKGYWRTYKGEFKNGQKCGQGIWDLTNNAEFEGFFDMDLPNGEGYIKRTNHDYFTGKWENGELTMVISGKL